MELQDIACEMSCDNDHHWVALGHYDALFEETHFPDDESLYCPTCGIPNHEDTDLLPITAAELATIFGMYKLEIYNDGFMLVDRRI